MIRDVLAQAIADIERWQHESPERYDRFAEELHRVKLIMDTMRVWLDSPLAQDAEVEARLTDLRTALQRLDVSELLQARKRWKALVRSRKSHMRRRRTDMENK